MSEETSEDIVVEKSDDVENIEENGNGKKKKTILIVSTLTVIFFVVSLIWWVHSKNNISTDNAFVEAKTVAISSKISGTVLKIYVTDNQFVKAQDIIAEIDDRDYKVKVESAQALMLQTKNDVNSDLERLSSSKANVEAAAARMKQADIDFKRAESLYKKEVIPKEQLDKLKTAKTVASAQLKEAKESYNVVKTQSGLSSKDNPRLKLRESQLKEAMLQHSYTTIRAPFDGYITRKNVEPGVNIQPGQPIMALVPLQESWIIANYKEAQLAHIKSGQTVTFTVDAYPGKKFKGKVDSIMAGTGSAFSLLPPENATGNYVKVVQRVPVKILIENQNNQEVLRVGMSVVPTVHVNRDVIDILKDIFR